MNVYVVWSDDSGCNAPMIFYNQKKAEKYLEFLRNNDTDADYLLEEIPIVNTIKEAKQLRLDRFKELAEEYPDD